MRIADHCGHVAVQLAGGSGHRAGDRRSRLEARVSSEEVGDRTTATTGTDTNVENAPPHDDRDRKRTSPRQRREVRDEVERGGTERTRPGGLIARSAWNDVDGDVAGDCCKSDRKQKRNRKERPRSGNVNASTQTTNDGSAKVGERPARSRTDRAKLDREDVDGVDGRRLVDAILRLAAPVLAGELTAALDESGQRPRKPANPPDYQRRRRLQQFQRLREKAEYRSPWQQTADIMARRPVTRITSYPASPRSRCPRCGNRRPPPPPPPPAAPLERRLVAEVCRYCDRACASSGEVASTFNLAKLRQLCNSVLANHVNR